MRNNIFKNPIYILYIFVILNLLIGLFIVSDYGRSTDETSEAKRSNHALNIYLSNLKEGAAEGYEELGLAKYYGTASTASIQFIKRFLFPNRDHTIKVIDHYGYFVFFQAAVLAIFLLAKHFLNDWSSLGVALLFGTQPLLFGHAFINPKDIPLLTVFLFTALTGFRMVNMWLQNSQKGEKNHGLSAKKEPTWKARSRGTRLFLIILVSIFLILWSNEWITNKALEIVEYGYTTKGESLLGQLFAATTTYGSLEGYLGLTTQYLYQLLRWVIFASPFLLLMCYFISGRNRLFRGYINLNVLLASAVWGFAISTRVVAIAAGGIVGLYALLKLKQKAIFPLMVYTITSSIISFITWPFLWVFGLQGYFDSLSVFNDFPWPGKVLFEGSYLDPNNLPIRYLPKLMMLQFTETLVILAVMGFVISIYLLFKKDLDNVKWLLLFGWVFLPVIYTMISHPVMYNNFRQYLFISPPLFILAGLTIQQITSKLKKNTTILAVCLIFTIPGIISMIKNHPFQYIYFNGFVGGISGAYQNYDFDYYNTAYKSAMDYVNENMPPGAEILIWKDNLLGEIYSKGEFTFTGHTTVPEEEYQLFDYAIMPSGRFDHLTTLENYPVIHSVDIDDESLLVILEISQNGD